MDQKQADHDLITAMWHLLRDYGDITTESKDDARWQQVIDAVNEQAGKDDMSRYLMNKLLGAMEDRANGIPIGSGDGIKKNEKHILDMFRKMSEDQQKTLIAFMEYTV